MVNIVYTNSINDYTIKGYNNTDIVNTTVVVAVVTTSANESGLYTLYYSILY